AVTISSMCTVFAESEVVSLIADDTPTPDIIHGLDVSVARKTAALAHRVGGEPPYLMTGGVAQNQGVVKALSEVLDSPVATHEDSQLCGAIGAAVLGIRRLKA
ncbi:MAG: 2-hydroxyglutaryl-CoA dehydratase, partial [Coriobacteriaceae bacterium]